MKKILIVLLMLYSGILYSQKNYIGYSVWGQNPIMGINWERSFLNEKVSAGIGLGFISGSVTLKYQPLKNVYISNSHFLVMNPQIAGWKNYTGIGLSKKFERTRINIDIGPKIEWFDRKAHISPNFGINFQIIL
jgi:hypothetical protein